MINKTRKNSRREKLKGIILRVRRNHALEHASIHVLSSQYRNKSIIGRSDSQGFYLYTELPFEAIEEGIYQAERRLRSGEKHLAIHPNCGTNLLAGGIMSAGAAFLSLQGSKDEKFHERIQRLPFAILGAMAGILLAQPIGTRIQRYLTTESDLGSLSVSSIRATGSGKSKLYRIITQDV
jgi:hypothetical protein